VPDTALRWRGDVEPGRAAPFFFAPLGLHTGDTMPTRARLLPLVILALAATGLLLWSLADGPATPPPTALEDDGPATPRAAPPDALTTSPDEATHPTTTVEESDGSSDARAAAAARVTGVVRDETGHAIGDARVVLRVIDPQSLRGAPYPDLETLAETRSERDGTFALKGLTQRWLRVVASKAGRATVGRRIASGGVHVVLVLPPAGALHLDVRRADGHAAADTHARLRTAQTLLVAERAPDGTLRFDRLPPGAARVEVVAADGAATTAGPYAIRAGATTEALVILPPGIALAGRVLDDATDAPVKDARVFVAHPGRSTAAAPTGADGRFGPVAGGGAGERVFLSASAEGYLPALETVILRAQGTQEVQVRLVRGEPWTGLVRRADGRPAPHVTVGYTSDGVAGHAPASTLTAADGRFSLPPPPNPAPGRRVVLRARDGGALAALALRPDMPRPASLVLTLVEGARVAGRVVDTEGQPLASVLVSLLPAWDQVPRGRRVDDGRARLLAVNEAGFEGLATASDGSGSWILTGVPAGPYRLRFRHKEQTWLREDILTVAGAQTAAGTQTIGGGLALEGRVRDDDGTPLAGVTIRVAPAGVAAASRRTVTESDGSFVVLGLTTGRHRVTATWAGREPLVGQVDVDAPGGALIELAFDAPAGLGGTVTDGVTVYGGLLTIALQADGGRSARQQTFHTRVVAGRLHMDDLPTGSWNLEAWSPDGHRARAEGLTLSAGARTDVRLVLRAETSLTGHVLAPGGAAVASARITLHDAATGRRLLATADVRGAYRFDGLAAGSYTLDASGRGGAVTSASTTLVAGRHATLDLRLAPAGEAEIVVLDERGRPVAGTTIAFRAETGAVRSPRPVRTDATGTAHARDLPLGTLAIRARAPDGRMATGSVLVDGNAKAARVTLRLSAAPR